MRSKQQGWPLALSLLIVFAVGGLSYLLTGKAAMDRYAALPKPPLSPPDWLFPVVWTVLYGLMGVSAWLVWKKAGWSRALEPYGLQLLLNAPGRRCFSGWSLPGPPLPFCWRWKPSSSG